MEAVKENIIEKLISQNGGIQLDIGCGGNKLQNFVGLDIRALPGVDIVHDIEDVPWPLPDECVLRSFMNHVYEHLDPKKSLLVMDEIWRITRPQGILTINMPYGCNNRFIQDPTHTNPANEVTWQYFDPRHPLWRIYQPRPWLIVQGYPVYQPMGDMEVVLKKITVKKKK